MAQTVEERLQVILGQQLIQIAMLMVQVQTLQEQLTLSGPTRPASDPP